MSLPILLIGCEPPHQADPAPSASVRVTSADPKAIVEADVSAPPACSDPIDVYAGGARIGTVCEADAPAKKLTVIDLSDDWTSRLFALGPEGESPTYRETLIALADERLGDGPEWDRPKSDRFLELYGIFPTMRVMGLRLTDDARHRCHDEVDDAPLEKPIRDIDPWADRDRQRSEAARMRQLEKTLEAERKKRGAGSLEELRAEPELGLAFRNLERVGERPRAIAAMQAHLRCEGLLKKGGYEGSFDHGTTEALRAFQRKHMIVSYALDEETRAVLATDSRELDFRGLLRVLRERVVDATGLIEDGSASGALGEVVGRVLETRAFRFKGEPLSAPGAPDLVAAATDAAARALGWTSPEAATAFFRDLEADATKKLRVAVELPPVPDYHGPEMELRAEIDRGDVWYDSPFTKRGGVKAQPVERRPNIILYTKQNGADLALVRWPTTIGGWKPERTRPKEIVLAYKMSPPGKRLWREILAAPVWIPPESTPKRDLIRPRADGSWVAKTDLFGPGYASAYGLTALVHHQKPRASAAAGDEGIRTHGSVSYGSILRGTSHGCHRLFNHQALRLSSFLLAHRKHKRVGADVLGYHRRFEWQGKKLDLSFESRGYRYELDPPVEVEVLQGRIMSSALVPDRPQPLPEEMRKLFKQELLED